MSEILSVTLNIGCPVGCLKYCPQEVLTSKYQGKRIMSLSDFKALLSSVPREVGVAFSAFSEPFLNSEIVEMVKFAHYEGHGLYFYSTLFNAYSEDVLELVKFPFKIFDLHLNDGVHVHFPITIEYCQNVFTVIHKVRNLSIVIMNDLFKSCGRENVARGILPKKKHYGFCYMLNVPNFSVLPNGDMQLCCNDFGLWHTIGNLFEESYFDIRQRFLNSPKDFELCKYCVHYSIKVYLLEKYRSWRRKL